MLAFNISALITFYVHINNFKKDNSEFRINQRPNPRCFIKEELNLTDEQLTEFDDLRKAQIRNSRKSRANILKKHNVLYTEITKENTESAKIDSLLKDISRLHIQLYRNNIKHYNELKMICNDKQIDKLNKFYREVMFQQKKKHSRNNYKHKKNNRVHRK